MAGHLTSRHVYVDDLCLDCKFVVISLYYTTGIVFHSSWHKTTEEICIFGKWTVRILNFGQHSTPYLHDTYRYRLVAKFWWCRNHWWKYWIVYLWRIAAYSNDNWAWMSISHSFHPYKIMKSRKLMERKLLKLLKLVNLCCGTNKLEYCQHDKMNFRLWKRPWNLTFNGEMFLPICDLWRVTWPQSPPPDVPSSNFPIYNLYLISWRMIHVYVRTHQPFIGNKNQC